MKSVNKNHAHHTGGGRYIKDLVYGANDGIITTFAVVAGVAGASLSSGIVILIGLANLLADGFSMAASNYLGTKSELELFKREKGVERSEIRENTDLEKNEIRNILANKGYAGDDLEKMAELIFKNEKFWVDLMMQEELQMAPTGSYRPKGRATVTFFAFVIAGFLPIVPYLLLDSGSEDIFKYAILLTAVTLFAVGSLRSIFIESRWYKNGLEMLFVGGFAASIAYVVGYALRGLVA